MALATTLRVDLEAATLLCAAFLDATRPGAGSGACSTSPPVWAAAMARQRVSLRGQGRNGPPEPQPRARRSGRAERRAWCRFAPGVIDTDIPGSCAAPMPLPSPSARTLRRAAPRRPAHECRGGRRACSPVGARRLRHAAGGRRARTGLIPSSFFDAAPTMLRLALLLPLLLAACAARALMPMRRGTLPRPSHRPSWRPTPTLVAQGIPPIPAALVAEVARYTDFRGHNLVEWHPQRRELLVSHRKAGASTLQLFRVAAPLAEPEALTDAAEPVRRATWGRAAADYLVFARGKRRRRGRPALPPRPRHAQRHAADRPVAAPRLRTWLNRSSQLLTSSVPLDRSTQGGAREQPRQTFTLIDPPSRRASAASPSCPAPAGTWAASPRTTARRC